jgi:hypothetical protein
MHALESSAPKHIATWHASRLRISLTAVLPCCVLCCICFLRQEHNVDNVDLVKQLIEEANHRRSVGSTAANADSSRSHSIMQFALKRYIAGGAASRLVSAAMRQQRAAMTLQAGGQSFQHKNLLSTAVRPCFRVAHSVYGAATGCID